MREQKILTVNLRMGGQLVIVSQNITHVQQLPNGACRVHFNNTFIDIARDIDWMKKHLTGDYDESGANQL